MLYKYKRQIVFGVVILSVALLATLFWHEEKNIKAQGVPNTAVIDFVERVKIPHIGVDAIMEHTGLTPDGKMDTPDGPANVGWYSLGTYPGQEGTAVIAGHRGWKNGEPAVFDNLDKLNKGDTIVTVDTKGNEHTFEVRETRIYKKNSRPPEVFTSSSGTHVNLVTCVGAWDVATHSSDERLVVFTDLMQDQTHQ